MKYAMGLKNVLVQSNRGKVVGRGKVGRRNDEEALSSSNGSRNRRFANGERGIAEK